MPDQAVEVWLAAHETEPSKVISKEHRFSGGERVRRALGIFGGSLLMILVVLPVPIVHLIAPVLIVLVGAFFALKQLRANSRLAITRIPCPKCGAINRLGGGIGFRDSDYPGNRLCVQCRRVLTVSLHPVGLEASPR